jgi:hypothetical protein
MRALDLANAATDELGGDDEESSPFGAPEDSELIAQMKKFARCAAAKDYAGMAKAFRGADEACGSYDKDSEETEE